MPYLVQWKPRIGNTLEPQQRSLSYKWRAGILLASLTISIFHNGCFKSVYAQGNEDASKTAQTELAADEEVQRNFSDALIPRDSIMFSNRGYVRSRVGDVSGALEDFDTAIAMDSKNVESFSGRGYLRLYNGEVRAAISDFNQALEVDPKNAAALCGRGQARADMGDEKEALADFNLAIKLDPTNAPSYIFRGYHLERHGDQPRAIADYDQTIKLDPNNALAYCYRGTAREAVKDNKGAVSDFTKVIKFDPQYAWAYYRRGQAREQLGDKIGAASDFNTYIKLKPTDPWGFRARGFNRQQRGDTKSAIRDYTKAIELEKTDPWTFSARGFLRGKTGDTRGSILDYQQAARLERSKSATNSKTAIAATTTSESKKESSTTGATREPSISLITNPAVYTMAAKTLTSAQKSFGPAITNIKQILIFHRPGPHCQTMMWDADKGIFCIFMANQNMDAFFQGNLGHELLHLLNAKLCDPYVEGVCSVFGEEALDDETKRKAYDGLLNATPFYRETYLMMKEVKKSISPQSYESIFRYASYDPAKRWMHIEIDQWLKSIPESEQQTARTVIGKYADDVESRMPKDGMYVFMRPSGR